MICLFRRILCFLIVAGLGLAVAGKACHAAAPDGYDLLSAALRAGGMSAPSQLNDCHARFDALAERLQSRMRENISQGERIAIVFEFLHGDVLTGSYFKDVSEAQRTLGQGDYNCVSATVLFVALCRRCGLNPQIWSAPGHVLCRFPGPEPLDVETTCPNWLREGRRTAASRAGLRQISARQLVAKIYYNSGLLHLERREFELALVALRKSCELDPLDLDARENLLAGLNNAALADCSAGRFDTAAERLDEARQIDPHYGPLLANDVHLHQRWTVQLCAEHRYAAALELLERGYARRPDVPLFANGRAAVYDLWSRHLQATGEHAEALVLTARSRRVKQQLAGE